MVFNGTENYKFSHNHNIVNFISTRWWVTIVIALQSATGEWATAKRTPYLYKYVEQMTRYHEALSR